MSFYEIQFPSTISYGSSGGPGFSTTIVGLDAGAEQRVSRWSKAKRKFDVSYGIKTYLDLQDVVEFYMSVKGAAYGFRYKDWVDFTTASDGRSAYTSQDVALKTNSTGGDVASGFTVQLTKRYQRTDIDGASTTAVIRDIKKPVKGKVAVAIKKEDGSWVAALSIPAWTVNSSTGIITFTGQVDADWTVYGGCEFDVPVRFTKEMDSLLSINMDTFQYGTTESIELVEVIDHGEHLDEYFYGGSMSLDVPADVTIAASQGRVIALTPDASGWKVILPDPWSLASGGPYFYLINTHATYTMLLRDARGEETPDGHDGYASSALSETLVGSDSAGSTVTAWIMEDTTSGAKSWKIWESGA